MDRQGISPLEERVAVVRNFPCPTTCRKLREFLGLVNFYHRFIPHCAAILQPLHSLLSSKLGEDHALHWTTDADTAFSATKEALAKASLLFHPKPNAPISIMTDASDMAVIAYFSKKLKPAETRYSAFDKELLAVYLAIKHFRHFVEGRTFHILTDHKPLTFALTLQSSNHFPRQTRQLDFIVQFTSDIRHIKGTDNPVADALSRIGIDALSVTRVEGIDFEKMAAAQQQDPEIKHLLAHAGPCSFRIEPIPLQSSTTTLLCDVATGVPRPIVPSSFRQEVFQVLHSLSHPGIRATQQLIVARFVWPHVNTDVRNWARSCLHCQRSNVQRHTSVPSGTFAAPDVRFDHVHMDIVGPLPASQGFRYLLTVVDWFTRWPEALPLMDITAISVARAFIFGWVSRFPVPSLLTTDRGRQFESTLLKELTCLLGCTRIHTTAYHPSANGLVERFHCQMKASLKACATTTGWIDSLPLILLGLRTALKQDLGCSTAELVYGTTLRIPGEFFAPGTDPLTSDPSTYAAQLKLAMRSLKAIPPRADLNRTFFVPKDLLTCPFVFVRHDAVRRPLQAPYDGPFKVLRRSDKHFTLDLNGREEVISIDRLKPAYMDNTTTAVHSLFTEGELYVAEH